MDRFESFARVVRLLRDLSFLALLIFGTISIWSSAKDFRTASKNLEKMQASTTKDKITPEQIQSDINAGSKNTSFGPDASSEAYEDLIKYISDDLKNTQSALREQAGQISALTERLNKLEQTKK